ncbi:MAG: hypothetical protein ACEB74_09830 [Desulfovibrio aminophilus]|jgi:hypothetical protein|uniref:hypothetical protein n=1 Tax=Desulfovibrio aminophilus TaxID=81425 RepID=UPI002A42CF5D|nr:hypothetical protein [Desulfovibrionaceae bacterium]
MGYTPNIWQRIVLGAGAVLLFLFWGGSKTLWPMPIFSFLMLFFAFQGIKPRQSVGDGSAGDVGEKKAKKAIPRAVLITFGIILGFALIIFVGETIRLNKENDRLHSKNTELYNKNNEYYHDIQVLVAELVRLKAEKDKQQSDSPLDLSDAPDAKPGFELDLSASPKLSGGKKDGKK